MSLTIYLFSKTLKVAELEGAPFLESHSRRLPDGSLSQCSAITLDKIYSIVFKL